MPLGDLLLDSELDEGAIFKVFWCAGCSMYHGFQLNIAIDPHFSWDGNVKSPTFKPALKIRNRDKEVVCHLSIINGMIKYHADSKHIFAGMTISMSEA